MKTKLITTIDLDGAACSVLTKSIFIDLEIEYIQPDDIYELLELLIANSFDYDLLIVTGFYIDTNIRKLINQIIASNIKVLYIKNSYELSSDKEDWYYGKLISEDNELNSNSYILYELLKSEYSFNNYIISFINQVRMSIDVFTYSEDCYKSIQGLYELLPIDELANKIYLLSRIYDCFDLDEIEELENIINI